MDRAKWEAIVDQIKEKFGLEEQGQYQDEPAGGREVEFVVFTSPLGRVKLELAIKPKVIDKKVIYSNRIGSTAQVEYVYDPEEKVYQLTAYRWDDDQEGWQEIKSSDLGW